MGETRTRNGYSSVYNPAIIVQSQEYKKRGKLNFYFATLTTKKKRSKIAKKKIIKVYNNNRGIIN